MSEELNMRGLTMTTTKAGLTPGTGPSFTTANDILYCISGKAYTKAPVTNGTSPLVDVNTGVAFKGVGPNKGSVFVFGLDAAGAVKVAQGSVEDLDGSGGFVTAPAFPDIPANFCPFAYLMVRAGSGAATWMFGVSNQNFETDVVYTRQDVMTLPQIPQLS